METSTKNREADWCIMAKEAVFLGLVIKDPVWYLIVYPLIFALTFGGLLVGIEESFIDISETLAATFSIVFAGFITLILRSEAKK